MPDKLLDRLLRETNLSLEQYKAKRIALDADPRPPQPGDVYQLPIPSEIDIEWVVAEASNDRLFLLPADGNSLAGNRDLTTQHAVTPGSFVVRCGFGIWAPTAMFKSRFRTEVLPPADREALRQHLLRVRDGTVGRTEAADEIEADPEYDDWLVEVDRAIRALEATVNAGEISDSTLQDPQAPPSESTAARASPRRTPDPWGRDTGIIGVPKRLIEVDLPIARISAHDWREKSIRRDHISNLHIWWARRPLGACRAVICAALWPDPADPHCPQSFRDEAARHLVAFARQVNSARITQEKETLHKTASRESLARWEVFAKNHPPLDPDNLDHQNILRFALLDFIADFANWDNSTVPAYLDTSRALTQAAHEALGGEPGTRPLVADPFAGGGSIPLEALRVGADAFASDLNPVAVLLNKVLLEYIPKYGQRLADEVRKWGQWIKEQAEKELAEFYPKDPDGATPIAYLWARTIHCDNPNCGAEVPLIRSLWLARKSNKSAAMKILPNPTAKRVDFEILDDAKMQDVTEGTVKRGSATCPCCSYITPVKSVREQLKKRRGGAADARLYCVVTMNPKGQGRSYRLPTDRDRYIVAMAATELEKRKKSHTGPLSLVPDEPLDLRGIRHTGAMIYGINSWGDLFTPRQLLALTTLNRFVVEVGKNLAGEKPDGLAEAVQTCLGAAVDRQADFQSSLVTWTAGGEFLGHTFTRKAIPFVWDFAEGNPWADAYGHWDGAVNRVASVPTACRGLAQAGHVEIASAAAHPLPNASIHALVTDPPHYDAVPYAYLSDFFYVWMRRSIGNIHPVLLKGEQVPKDTEIVVDRTHELSNSTHDIAFYERELTKAFSEGRRILRPDGVAVIVIASKTTASWETILQAVVDAEWTITGSWPIDTEREAQALAQGQARLAWSLHFVCRPRTTNEVGDWRDVLLELPQRIHEWMPRLVGEGVVGAHAIYACLGPALEIFSRYGRVDRATGESVTLKEYLEHVWASVSKEALSTIFRDADPSGLEPDARLTAMWLWMLGNAKGKEGRANRVIAKPNEPNNFIVGEDESEEVDDEDKRANGKTEKSNGSGFFMEFDAARKIAQGVGINLEESRSIAEVKGKTARLLPVRERTEHLFGKDKKTDTKPGKRNQMQQSLFELLEEAERDVAESIIEMKGSPLGTTILDRLHQAMILFGAQQGEWLNRFLMEDGVAKDPRFWKLAQALATLYPRGTDEHRWVDGVLAKKKGLRLEQQ